jgi:hypothetical protein
MNSLKFLNRQAISTATALGMLIALVVPSLVPLAVSADDVTNRSITMSNATANASNVSYEVKFDVDSSGAAGAFVLSFCTEGPVIQTTCTGPTGLSLSSATTPAGATVSQLTTPEDNTIVVTKAVANSGSMDVTLNAIHNPTNVETFYARIVTYDTETNAKAYTDTDLKTGAIDGGGLSLATSSNIGVSAAVRETLVFCVASDTISEDCGDASSNPPNVTLGTNGALDASTVDTGDIYTQITTNATHGAVINLKSDKTGCGGLMILGSSNCDIPAAGSTGYTDDDHGTAFFGVKLNTPFATSGAASPTGTLAGANGYNTTNYKLNVDTENDATGVTSPYGDQILDTSNAPINNQNMKLTFGASITANTPAGNYAANLNMIAAGKY